MDKLISDISSWYWWISVVLIGLLINLASAYAKPHLDRWIEKRSVTARAKRTAATTAFDAEVSRLASDPTLLLIAGQRLQNVQHTTLSVGAFLGFLLALSIFFGASPPTSIVQSALQLIAAAGIVVLMFLHFWYMRRETELEDTVRAARERYDASCR